MKSNLITRMSLTILLFTASVPALAMGNYYRPDPRVVTTEEKINHYLYYLVNHGLNSFGRLGAQKAVPELVERVIVDGARILVPEVLGCHTPPQKRLINLGVEGLRQSVKFGTTAQQQMAQRGQKIKKSEAMKMFFTKRFIPIMAKSLVVDLMYHTSSHYAHSLLQQVGFNTAALAASPYSISGMLYQQFRGSGYGICTTVFDLVFGKKS